MSAKSQHNNILLAIIGFTTVVATVAVIGYFTLGRTPEVIQGEMEVSEYRVTCKLPDVLPSSMSRKATMYMPATRL